MRGILFLLAAAVLSLGAASAPLSAEEEEKAIYRYIHKDGTIVFTDDPAKIPEEYRESAEAVKLPPLMTLPPAPPPPEPETPSRWSRIKYWYGGLSPLAKVGVGGILPVTAIALWAFYFLGGRTNNPSAKLIIKIVMGVIVAGSVYLLYFIFLKTQAEWMTRDLPIKIDTGKPPSQILEPIKKEEQNRLDRIEEIADSP